MGLKSLLFKNTKLTSRLLSSVSPDFIERLSAKSALKTFQTALDIPAYEQILKDHDVDPASIKSIQDFKKLPIIDKSNYIQQFTLQEMSKESYPYLFYRSSGYSGQPTYWSQSPDDYKQLVEYMDLNFRLIFDIENKSTLVISLFAMSSWITGQQLISGLSQVSSQYDNMTVFPCGMVVDEPLEIIKRYGHLYDQIIIFSYPLTFKELVDTSHQYDIDLADYNIYGVIGAEGVTYRWSKYYSTVLNKEGEFTDRIISAFGTADTGIGIASEHAASHLIKEFSLKSPTLLQDLTDSDLPPMHFFQYNPLDNYIEEHDGDLIITKNKHLPLVRYNLHDSIKRLPLKHVMDVMGDHGYDLRQFVDERGGILLNLPFFAMYGRSDGTLILNGANIYLNSFKDALHHEDVSHLHTGKFRVTKIEEEDLFHNYKIEIELHSHVDPTEKVKKLIRSRVLDFLLENDKGYKSAYHDRYDDDNIGVIDFVSFEDESTLKHKYHDPEN